MADESLSQLGRLASAASSRLTVGTHELALRFSDLSSHLLPRRASPDLQPSPNSSPPGADARRRTRLAATAPPPTVRSTSTLGLTQALPTPVLRAQHLADLLSLDPVPLEKLMAFIFSEGVPDVGVDSPKLRAITWKLALGYLPVDHSHRPAQLAQQRQLYHQWVVELTTDPSALLRSSSPSLCGEREGVGGAGASRLRRVKVRAEVRADGQVRLVVNVEADEGEEVEVQQETEGVDAMDAEALGISDHPLSTEDGSVWREWHLDEELRQEIRKDVDRTLPDYSFFNREQPPGRLHHAAISRILFIYAKLNPGIRYVQGMNEILAPIYFVFCKEQPDPAREVLDMIEADAFFCFTNLMAECRDHFCSKLDHTAVGIQHKVREMARLISEKDPELGRFLQKTKVSPTFYGFRWITLMMTQEFDLPDVMRLWDSLLTDSRRFSYLIYVCAAMVLSIRDELISNNDFAFCVKALQRFDGRVPLQRLMASAYELYEQDYPTSARR